MISLSIFEIHEAGDGENIERGRRLTTLRKAQLFVVPFLTCAFIGWLIASAATDRSIADGIAETVRWMALAISDYTGK